MGIENYSKTPADNNSTPPNGWPEGMAPSAVNNSARQNMADLRSWYEKSQWINFGYSHSYSSATSFTIADTDYTSTYEIGRRIKAEGLTTGTIYGSIVDSTYAALTTVTVQWDSGNLENESLTISLGALTKSNDSIPYLNKKTGDIASASTIDLNKVNGDFAHITGTTAITQINLEEGQERVVKFNDSLVLTHSSNLVLPSSSDITTEPEDSAIFRGDSSGVVRCISYERANGKALAEIGLPVGSITIFGGSVAPDKFYICNGEAKSRIDDSELYAVIGTTYGEGDGTSTFNLPNFQGQFIRGLDTAETVDPGRTIGSSQDDAFQGHWHSFYSNTSNRINDGGGGPRMDYTGPGTNLDQYDHIQDPITDGTNGTPRVANETRPKNIAMPFIIKYKL